MILISRPQGGHWKANKVSYRRCRRPLRHTHHLQHISGDHLHTAHGGGESTHDGGDDVEGAHAEQQLLKEKQGERRRLLEEQGTKGGEEDEQGWEWGRWERRWGEEGRRENRRRCELVKYVWCYKKEKWTWDIRKKTGRDSNCTDVTRLSHWGEKTSTDLI